MTARGGDISPVPSIEVVEAVLRDGTEVLLRPIRPGDKGLLKAGFAQLSEESRTRRFLAPIRELGEERLRQLTEVDGRDHVAWVALRADGPDQGMGVARFVRLPEEPNVAEAAVTVVDAYQGRGLGTLLLGILAAEALARGVHVFRAYVAVENAPMLDLLQDLGAKPGFDAPNLLRIDVPLEAELLPDSAAGQVFKAVASRMLHTVARRVIL